MTRITFYHLVGRLKAGICDFRNGKLLMVSLLCRNDRGVGGKREMDTWVRHKIGLELCEIHIESTIKSQGSSDGGDNLTNETIQVGVCWTLDVQVSSANVVDSLVVNHESTVRVLQGGVGGQDGVVGFHNSSGDLWSRIDSEFQLGLFSIINRQTL